MLKTSAIVEIDERIHSWKFQVQKKIGSQDIAPSRIWACPGSFRAHPIFSRLVHGSNLILHIMIVWNGPDDLGILSLMFSVINYAWLTLFMQKWGVSAKFSRLAHLIDIFGIIMPRKGFVVEIVNFDCLKNAWIFSFNIISRINGCLYVWKPIFLSFYSTHGTPFDLGTLISEVHINRCLLQIMINRM